jgi:hypothetical protein
VVTRKEKRVTRRVMNINVEGSRGTGRPEKKWNNCVRQDMEEMDEILDQTSFHHV